MQHLSLGSRRHQVISDKFRGCQGQVRFFALHRIKPHAPPLVRAPVNSFEFQPCGRTPRRRTYRVSFGTERQTLPTPSSHRLQRGLPGYLILFAPHAFAPQRQSRPRWRLRHWCSSGYLRISPLHPEFRHPLTDSSQAVSNAIPRLSPGLSHLTYPAAYARFTPSNSD